jgi:hypothetical protein
MELSKRGIARRQQATKGIGGLAHDFQFLVKDSDAAISRRPPANAAVAVRPE